jgi:hypothetical protein
MAVQPLARISNSVRTVQQAKHGPPLTCNPWNLQVRWAPFRPTCFLTCSADWTMRLWDEAQHSSLWTFQLPNSKSEINDVQW